MNKTIYQKSHKFKISIKLRRIVLLYFLPISLLMLLIIKINKVTYTQNKCYTESTLQLSNNNFPLSLTGVVKKSQRLCYYFYAESSHKIILQSTANITLINPSKDFQIIQGTSKIILPEQGIYSIFIETETEFKKYQILLTLESEKQSIKYLVKQSPMRLITKFDYNQGNNQGILQPTYNLVNPPSFKKSQKLEQIINNIVTVVASKGLPINRLSVSLIDLDNSKYCSYAGYSDQEPRFPASVVKLFWMVYLYGQYEAGVIRQGTIPYKELQKMIQDSNNESASFIVDTITGTKSGENLTGYELQEWIQKRFALNLFFEQAGYSKINISQKVFPTSYIKNDKPTGRELQMRQDEFNPIRDYITTYNVARLLFEIERDRSISQKSSKQMKILLKRSLHPQTWKNKEFNAIEGFLGESLPRDAYFASKMGWNFNTRNDAAIIGSPDAKYKYILVIFGDDPSFYKDKKLFPELSRMIYEKMTK